MFGNIDDINIEAVRKGVFEAGAQRFGAGTVAIAGLAHQNQQAADRARFCRDSCRTALHASGAAQYAPRPRSTAGIERSMMLESSTRLQFST